MPQIINTNLFSLNAQRNLNTTQGSLQTSLERLSSGLRINSASDDAAGLAIAERFTSQIRGLNQAIRNSNDGISFSQTAEGALQTATDALQRVRELAVQSANDTNSSTDRQALNNEVQQLVAEVNRIANSTQFNGQNVLDGSASSLSFQVGANQNQTITVDGVDARGQTLGARTSVSGSFTQAEVNTAVAAGSGAGDLVIQGIAVDFSDLGAGSSTSQLASQINQVTSQTGVSAQLNTTVTTGDLAVASGVGTINGVQVALSGTAATDVATINALSTQTGVTAAVSGTAITLSNTDGSNIVVGGANLNGGTAATYQAGITLVGEVGTAYTATSTALVSAQGAELGAGQADNTVNGLSSNLQITVENLTAARSRIQDADFAAETANLTRSQILQQAGLAIVSQANSLPQNVLSLLQ